MTQRAVAVILVVALGAVAALFGKPSDPEALAAVGRAVALKVNAALPDRSRLAGPLTAARPTDRFPVEEQVRARIHSDKLMLGAAVDVLTGTQPGEVRLRGTVPTTAQKARAVLLAGETVGVDAVASDELRVGP